MNWRLRIVSTITHARVNALHFQFFKPNYLHSNFSIIFQTSKLEKSSIFNAGMEFPSSFSELTNGNEEFLSAYYHFKNNQFYFWKYGTKTQYSSNFIWLKSETHLHLFENVPMDQNLFECCDTSVSNCKNCKHDPIYVGK